MSYKETQPYNYPVSQYSEFEKKGHPGKFHKLVTCAAGLTIFTGSNYGAGGLLVPAGTTGTASFSNGGTIPLHELDSNTPTLYEFSLSSVQVDSGTVYVLIRNQMIR